MMILLAFSGLLKIILSVFNKTFDFLSTPMWCTLSYDWLNPPSDLRDHVYKLSKTKRIKTDSYVYSEDCFWVGLQTL